MTKNIDLGRFGEERAVDHLRAQGVRILARNWRCPEGELDIVAVDRGTLVVVEVKTRTGLSAGHPLEAVTPQKIARLRRLALCWLRDHPSNRPGPRIDVIGIVVGASGGETAGREVMQLDHLENVGA